MANECASVPTLASPTTAPAFSTTVVSSRSEGRGPYWPDSNPVPNWSVASRPGRRGAAGKGATMVVVVYNFRPGHQPMIAAPKWPALVVDPARDWDEFVVAPYHYRLLRGSLPVRWESTKLALGKNRTDARAPVDWLLASSVDKIPRVSGDPFWWPKSDTPTN